MNEIAVRQQHMPLRVSSAGKDASRILDRTGVPSEGLGTSWPLRTWLSVSAGRVVGDVAGWLGGRLDGGGSQDGSSRPRGLPSQLRGEAWKFEAPAGGRQVRENDLSGADRGGLSL
jgi:hypothetical protein